MELDAYDEMRRMEDHHWWFGARRRRVGPLIARGLAAAGERPRVLELGCGTGGNLAHHLEPTGARTVGLDVEPAALTYCRDRGLAVGLICGDGTRLPVRDASLDFVLALDVIEHFEHDDRVVAEIARVLRPGGQLVATVPQHPSLWSPHDEFLHHKRRYKSGELERTLEAQGLLVREREAFNLLLMPPIALVRWTKALVARSAGRPAAGGTDFFGLPGPLERAIEHAVAAEAPLARLVPAGWGVSLMLRAERSANADAASA